jgi:hypothetical protein
MMPRSPRFRWLLLLVLLWAPQPAPAWQKTAAPTAAAKPAARETARYGVFFQDARIGSMTTKLFDVQHEGKPAVRLDADSKMELMALGASVQVTITLSQVLDKSGNPLLLTQASSSLGRSTAVTARFLADRVVCDVEAGGTRSQQTVPIPPGVKLSGDPQTAGAAKGEGVTVGKKETLHFFEPTTLKIMRVDTEVLKSEERTAGGKKVQGYLIRSVNSLTGESHTWVDGQGRLLEDTSRLGIRMVREDLQAIAPTLAYAPPQDFALATSVVTAVKLPEPRKTGTLRVKISSVPDETLVLSDIRQHVESREKKGDAFNVLFRIHARELPARALAASPKGTGPGLSDAAFLGIHDAEIQQRAKALAAGETDRGVLARRIRAWVHGHMQKPNNVATPRTAAEILRSRDGVCRDYATLFTAVARAAGVPTRICTGMIYFEGRFFYHAWVECQLTGEVDGWYAFDPTLSDDFVDATHIKFTQGDPTSMYGAIRIIGQVQAEILEYR